MNKYPLIVRLTIYLLFLILLVFTLTQTRNFLYPVFLAVLFSYLLFPLARTFERWKLPRIMANILSILIAFSILFSAFYLLYKQLIVFAEDIPGFRNKAITNINRIEGSIFNTLGIEDNVRPGLLKSYLLELLETSGYFLEKLFTATTGTIAKLVLLPVYVFFMLYYRNKFYIFLLKVTPTDKHIKLEKIVNEVSQVTKRYMGGIVMVVSILCVLNSIGLAIVGIQYPILFGILSALMNFIPYFGTLIGGAIPFLFALLTEDSPGYAFGVLILFIIIQFVENNILTPNIVGGKLNINPFFIILSIIIGGIVWGLPGMIVSVPFLGMFKIVCDNVDSMKSYSFLISTQGTEKHAVTFKKIRELFKKRKEEQF
ncbi:MAG: AI-2E family transporter [Cytophagaceae bacterium]